MRIGDVVILLVWLAGHMALVLAFVNLAYRVRLPGRRWLVPTYLALGASGPALLVWLVAPRLARGMTLGEMAWQWQAWFYLGIIALVGGSALLMWRNRSSTPSAQVAYERSWRNVCDDVDPPPRGDSALSVLCGLPFNQVFQMETATRQIRFPRLPRAWDGLSILHLSDLHYHGTPGLPYYEWIAQRCMELRPDLIACTGDILDYHDFEEWIPATLGKLAAPLGCWFVLGNHDLRIDHERIRELMTRNGWKDVQGRWDVLEHAGHRMTIGGTEAPWFGEPPDPASAPPGDFRLLLTHTPHVRWWLRAARADLALAGHLHGGQVCLPILGPLVGGRYHGGLFQVGDGILHVSRGLGQIMPLRYFCRPEMTMIVLRGLS